AVRARARLECSATKHLAACRLDEAGDFINLLRRFDRARPAHNDELAAADIYPVHRNDRVVRMEIAACQLIRFRNFNDIFDSLHLAKLLCERWVRLADNADDRTVRAAGYMGLHPMPFDMLNNFGYALFRYLIRCNRDHSVFLLESSSI